MAHQTTIKTLMEHAKTTKIVFINKTHKALEIDWLMRSLVGICSCTSVEEIIIFKTITETAFYC